MLVNDPSEFDVVSFELTERLSSLLCLERDLPRFNPETVFPALLDNNTVFTSCRVIGCVMSRNRHKGKVDLAVPAIG